MESAIKSNDVAALTTLFESSAAETPELALKLAARYGRPIIFNHLITTYPSLTSLFSNQDLLMDALQGNSIPVWETILRDRPDAKNQRFGHHGTIVEFCVRDHHDELLEFLLQQGARVETTGRPILLRANHYGSSDHVKELLIKYGASQDYEEEE